MDQAKRRIPIVAFSLSILAPGLGHVYNGNLLKGILFCGLWFLLFTAAYVGLTGSLSGLICGVIIVILCSVFIAIHATIDAVRLQAAHLKWYNKWYVYVCAWLVVILPLQAVDLFTQQEIGELKAFRVPMDSMAPTLKKGEYFMAILYQYGDWIPERGDIVIFPFSDDRSKRFVKRIVGLPGEQIQIKNKIVFINGQALDDPWGVRDRNKTFPADISPRDNYGPVSIPEGYVFVMGDNRDFSSDSRFWGFVDIEDIQGKPLFIYWSDDLSRVGKQLE